MTGPGALMQTGLPAQQAKRLGLASGTRESSLNGGAAFASAQAIGQFQFYVRANAQTSLNVYQLPSNAEIGSQYIVFNIGGITGGVTANVYPPTSGTINVNGGATATLTAIVSGKGAYFVAVTASTFDAFLSN